jgi:hypothetical protein
MFKLLLLVAVVAATPVIELQLDQAGLRKTGSTFKSERSANTQWVHHCAAKTSAASVDCALPQARAYDHHDGNIAVQSAIYLINDDNKTGMWKKGSVNYNRRSEYIVKYDAADAAGNKADQVIFAIILDDQTAPVFNFGQKYTRECERTVTVNVPKPTATDNIDGSVAVTINGKSNIRQAIGFPFKQTTYSYSASDKAGVFGKNGRNNVVSATKVFTVQDTEKPTIHDKADWSTECKTGKVVQTPLTTCSDKCDHFKQVGVCIGTGRKQVKIAGTYSQFNSGHATGCEHRHHYLYEYKGADCVWTSNKQTLKSPHAFTNAFVRFQMAEYGNLEDSDFLLVQLKFYGTHGTSTEWIDTVKLQDDVLGWRWTTIMDAPGTGYFQYKGKTNTDWKTFNAEMQRNHREVQIRVTLRSNQNYAERHILDNMQVFGSECEDAFVAGRKGAFNVKYTCKDKKGNVATPTSTRITITDTTAPVVQYYGNHKIQHSAGVTMTHSNYLVKHTCRDSCCGNLDNKVKITWMTSGCTHATASTHGATVFNTLKPGTYYQKFTCTDCNGNAAKPVCRTIVNEDKKKPIITILGKDIMTIEATHDANYVDDGATCSDQVDGVISQDVEVSGDVVNLSKPATYNINYNCKDAAGNKADTIRRRVVVRDTTCPTCVVNGATKVTREASFTYNDAGAVCTDSISLGTNKEVVTNPVNTEKVGTYVVTYRIKDKAGNWNDGKCTGAKQYKRTVTVKDTLKPVIHLKFGSNTFHKSAATDKGVNGQANPAAKLMAETSSVNGWIVGAIASAVAGVALLALGSKQTTTSVPV